MKSALFLIMICSLLLLSGCVERKVTFLSEPSGADVYFDGNLVGKTPVTINFTYYGKHAILIQMNAYSTINGEVDIKSPWHQKPGLDFFSENLYPYTIIDEQSISFKLEPVKKEASDEAIKRARALKIEYEKFLKGRGDK